ncbi:MAG: tetratricopeptide repeat-containing sensor histidine kinase [Bacteroidota bacterium]
MSTLKNHLVARSICSVLLLSPIISLAQEKNIYDSLLSTANSLPSSPEKVDALIQLAMEYRYAYDSSNTVLYAGKAAEIARNIEYPEGEIDANYEIGWILRLTGHYDEAERVFKQIIADADAIGYLDGKASGLNGMSTIYSDQGKVKDALEINLRIYEIDKVLGDDGNLASTLGNLAINNEDLGNYNQALDYSFKAIEILGNLGDRRNTGYIYSNIGSLYQKLDEEEKAIEYSLRAMEIHQEIDDPQGIVSTSINLGSFFSDQGNYERALVYANRALEACQSIESPLDEGVAIAVIGRIRQLEGNYEDALLYYSRALEIGQEMGASIFISDCLISIGEVHKLEGRLLKARTSLKEALSMALENGNPEGILDATGLLASVESDLNNYKPAYEAHVLYKEMADSLSNTAQAKEISRLEAEFEFRQEKDSIEFASNNQRIALEKDIENRRDLQFATFIVLSLLVILILILYGFFRSKRKSNSLLELQKKEISDQRDELQALNSLKDRVFSIVAHDLRNPINSLQGLLSMVKEDGALSREETTMYFGRLAENVKGISNLLNNLLYWAKSQMKNGLQPVPEACELENYVSQVIELYAENSRSKNIKTIVDYKSSVPCVFVDPEILLFILRNFLNNAYKFSAEGSTVTISTIPVGSEEVKINVRDEGVGMDEKTKNSLFKDFVDSKPGTQSEKGSGLGMMLCKEFLNLSSGSVGVDSEPGQGSTFWFVLPVAQ